MGDTVASSSATVANAAGTSSQAFMASIATNGEGAIPTLIKATEVKVFGGMPLLSYLIDSRPELKSAVGKALGHTARPLMFAIAGVSCFFFAKTIYRNYFVKVFGLPSLTFRTAMSIEWSGKALRYGVEEHEISLAAKHQPPPYSPDFVCRAINHFFTDLENNHRDLMLSAVQSVNNSHDGELQYLDAQNTTIRFNKLHLKWLWRQQLFNAAVNDKLKSQEEGLQTIDLPLWSTVTLSIKEFDNDMRMKMQQGLFMNDDDSDPRAKRLMPVRTADAFIPRHQAYEIAVFGFRDGRFVIDRLIDFICMRFKDHVKVAEEEKLRKRMELSAAGKDDIRIYRLSSSRKAADPFGYYGRGRGEPDETIGTGDVFWKAERPVDRNQRIRPMESVYLPPDVKLDIRSQIDDFLRQRVRMQDAALPSHRTFMLFGPPGNGKTSYIKALANDLNLNIFQLNLGNGSLANNDNIIDLLKLMPKPSILLLDDIDGYAGVGPNKEILATPQKGQGGVSHDKLLQVLDGIEDDLYSICFMTTNYHDELTCSDVGRQLFRRGRLDIRREFHNAEPIQVKQMFLWFYKSDWNTEKKQLVCGADCVEGHHRDGPCLVCYQPYSSHSGHMCVGSTLRRGSWPLHQKKVVLSRSLDEQEEDFLKAFESVVTAITPPLSSAAEPSESDSNTRNRRDLFQVRSDRLVKLKTLVMKEAFGKVKDASTGTFDKRAEWSADSSTPSWLKVLAYVASKHFESESMCRKYHVSDVQAYFQCMLFQQHRYMDNPVFVAMEMPRFETIIQSTNAENEQLDSCGNGAVEAARYTSEPDPSDYVASIDQLDQGRRVPVGATQKSATPGRR